MKKTKVENVSEIKLDFFLKQNNKDIRVVLNPGEHSWCDHESQTKSMILYERKKLIKTSELKKEKEVPVGTGVGISLVSVEPMSGPSGLLFHFDVVYDESPKKKSEPTPLEKAKQETEAYKKESERTYKGKKRGRKKKRGPKPGSHKKKQVAETKVVSGTVSYSGITS